MSVPREKKTWDSVKRLALDEIAMRKGHQDFVTVVGDIERGDLLEVIDSHRSEEIIAVLKQQPIEVRAQVAEVSIDMWGGATQSHCKECFPTPCWCMTVSM